MKKNNGRAGKPGSAVSCTKHAVKRLRQRQKANEWVSRELAATAFEIGRRAGDFSGKERHYILQKQLNHNTEIVVHAGLCLAYDPDDRCLITAFRVPDWFGKNSKRKTKPAKAIGDRSSMPVRNARRYARMTDTGFDGRECRMA